MAQPNVLLLTLDAVRPDRLRLYGGRVEMPHLERLAERGMVCENAWAQGPVTWISLASVFTGLWPMHHGLMDLYCRLDPAVPTLAEMLRDNGYHTAGWPAILAAGREMGFDKGFDLFEERFTERMKWGHDYFQRPLEENFAFIDVSETIIRFSEWSASMGPPWFAWLHYFDCHHMPEDVWQKRRPPDLLIDKYYPKQGLFRRRPKEARKIQYYDAKLAWADHWLGKLLEKLDLERTLVIIHSDHGEAFDYPEYPDHDQCRPEELRVVLVCSLPGARKAGRVKEPIRLIDIAPTILEATGVQPARPLDGLSILQPTSHPRMILAVNGYTRHAHGKATFYLKGHYYQRENPEQDKVRKALEGLGYI